MRFDVVISKRLDNSVDLFGTDVNGTTLFNEFSVFLEITLPVATHPNLGVFNSLRSELGNNTLKSISEKDAGHKQLRPGNHAHVVVTTSLDRPEKLWVRILRDLDNISSGSHQLE